jgi:hypothetical protein
MLRKNIVNKLVDKEVLIASFIKKNLNVPTHTPFRFNVSFNKLPIADKICFMLKKLTLKVSKYTCWTFCVAVVFPFESSDVVVAVDPADLPSLPCSANPTSG